MFGEASAMAHVAASLGNESRAAFYRAEAQRWTDVLEKKLWSKSLNFFVNRAEEPPAALHREWRRYGSLGRSQEVQTYLGCHACMHPMQATWRACSAKGRMREKTNQSRPA